MVIRTFTSFCKGCYLGRVGATRITRFWNCFAMCVLFFGPETISCKMWHSSNMCHLQCNKNFRGNQRQIQRPLANVTSTISWIMMTMWLNYKWCGNRCPNWGKQYPKDYCSVHFDSLVKKDVVNVLPQLGFHRIPMPHLGFHKPWTLQFSNFPHQSTPATASIGFPSWSSSSSPCRRWGTSWSSHSSRRTSPSSSPPPLRSSGRMSRRSTATSCHPAPKIKGPLGNPASNGGLNGKIQKSKNPMEKNGLFAIAMLAYWRVNHDKSILQARTSVMTWIYIYI